MMHPASHDTKYVMQKTETPRLRDIMSRSMRCSVDEMAINHTYKGHDVLEEASP
jgi:hypothetical protein